MLKQKNLKEFQFNENIDTFKRNIGKKIGKIIVYVHCTIEKKVLLSIN